jgi:hypothetical protein
MDFFRNRNALPLYHLYTSYTLEGNPGTTVTGQGAFFYFYLFFFLLDFIFFLEKISLSPSVSLFLCTHSLGSFEFNQFFIVSFDG